MKKFLIGIARALCVMAVCVFAGRSSPSGGSTPSGNGNQNPPSIDYGNTSDPQRTKVIAGWMDADGNIKIGSNAISKTSEVVAVPKGQQAAIAVSSSNESGILFTTSRKVKLSSFVMSQYPVTRALFKAVMGETYFTNLGTQATANGTEDENPVTMTNWFDAIVFCNKLSSLCHLEPVYSYDFSTDGSGKMTDPEDWFKDTTNLSETVPTSDSSTNYSNWKDKVGINLKANGYRLPTEAEWEFCARGGDPNEEDWKYTYSGSNTYSEVAWCIETITVEGTNIVGGMSKANRLGIYDMSGNVWEWCDDYFNWTVSVDDDKYKDNEDYLVDPLGVSASSFRGLRGGSWHDDADYGWCGLRNGVIPYARGDFYGFRLVRSSN
ncbi:MAG: formylglycine-generating enzyme family protein [Treponema sp.]|nr:formylglycine-generating enzyme family protein [Candidatus Treponema scatequi]